MKRLHKKKYLEILISYLALFKTYNQLLQVVFDETNSNSTLN